MVEKRKRGPDFNENGVNYETHSFIVDAIEDGVHKRLTADQRNLIGMYFGTNASFFDLANIFHPWVDVEYSTVLDRVRSSVRSSLEALWEESPSDLRCVYKKEDVVLMKGQTIYKNPSISTRKSSFPARHS